MKNKNIFLIACITFVSFSYSHENLNINIHLKIEHASTDLAHTVHIHPILTALQLRTPHAINWLMETQGSIEWIKRYSYHHPQLAKWLVLLQKKAYLNGNFEFEKFLEEATLYVVARPGMAGGYRGFCDYYDPLYTYLH